MAVERWDGSGDGAEVIGDEAVVSLDAVRD